MAIIKNKSTDENRQFWSHVEAVAKEVRTWPQWMGNRGDQKVCHTSESEPLKSNDAKEAKSQ
jgi:hypothetical protein